MTQFNQLRHTKSAGYRKGERVRTLWPIGQRKRRQICLIFCDYIMLSQHVSVPHLNVQFGHDRSNKPVFEIARERITDQQGRAAGDKSRGGHLCKIYYAADGAWHPCTTAFGPCFSAPLRLVLKEKRPRSAVTDSVAEKHSLSRPRLGGARDCGAGPSADIAMEQ